MIGTKEKAGASTSTSGDDVEYSRLSKEREIQSKRTDTVPFCKVFAYADSTDYMLMFAGIIGAIGNGLCTPLMSILLGDLTNSFGDNQNSDNLVPAVSKVHNCHILLNRVDLKIICVHLILVI
ncbi:putative ABC transporter type 1, transmembrane domain superfamily [Helianthus annuus]|nr:putative ABC transporter type 1, transmembrane domain superfamily [Helianthus annuus]